MSPRPEVADRAPTPFAVSFNRSDDGPLLATVQGDLDLASAPAMQQQVLAAASQRRATGVILDFTDVGFMDSTGVRALITISKQLGHRPHAVVLLSPNRSVRKLLSLAGLDERTPIAATREDAERLLALEDDIRP